MKNKLDVRKSRLHRYHYNPFDLKLARTYTVSMGQSETFKEHAKSKNIERPIFPASSTACRKCFQIPAILSAVFHLCCVINILPQP